MITNKLLDCTQQVIKTFDRNSFGLHVLPT